MNQIKKNIKHCPFCGGEAIIIKTLSRSGAKEFYQIFCVECSNRTNTYYTPKRAQEKWNKRVKEDADGQKTT